MTANMDDHTLPQPVDGHEEPATNRGLIFSAKDMEKRAKRLKAEGKMPPLADVLKIIQKQP